MTPDQVIGCMCVALALAGCASPSYDLAPNPTPYEYDQPAPYYLYLPAVYTPSHPWPAFVGIHGFGGDGRQCLDMWQAQADQAGYVLICPSLADANGGWYTDQGEKALLLILRNVQEQVNIRPKVFLAGISAGAEFAQAFTFDYPGWVAGAAILSSGNYIEPLPAARKIPFLVVIGDQDAGLRGANSFAQLLQQQGFSVDLHVLPGVGHTFTLTHRDLTLASFHQTMDR
jgi:predicted esterase